MSEEKQRPIKRIYWVKEGSKRWVEVGAIWRLKNGMERHTFGAPLASDVFDQDKGSLIAQDADDKRENRSGGGGGYRGRDSRDRGGYDKDRGRDNGDRGRNRSFDDSDGF